MWDCEKHGKPWREHSDDERFEDGYHQARPGVWRKGILTDRTLSRGIQIRVFRSGLIRDLADPKGAELWPDYDHEADAPNIRTNAELKSYMELTGHSIAGTHEVHDRQTELGPFGTRVKGRKRVVSRGFEKQWREFDRPTKRR